MSPRGRRALTLGAILTAAILLRLHGLGETLPVNDEYFLFFQSLRPTDFFSLLSQLRINPHHMMLDPLLTFLAGRFDDSLWMLRLPSVLWGAAGVAGLWLLGFRLGGERLAAAASILLAASLLHLDWSRRTDFYALLTALSIFLAFEWRKMVDEPARWPRYAAWATVAFYSHPNAVLMPALHLMFSAFLPTQDRRRTQPAFIKAWVCAGTLFLPWFIFSARTLADRELFDYRQAAAVASPPLGTFVAELPLYLAQAPEMGPGRSWSESQAAFFAALYAFFWLVSLWNSRKRPMMLALHAALPFAAASIIGLDVAYRYFFAHRQFLWALPFYLLTVADGALIVWDGIKKPLSAGLRVPVGIAITAVLGGIWGELYLKVANAQIGVGRELSEMVETIARHAGPGDSFAFQHDVLAQNFLYHYDRKAFREPRLDFGGGRYSYNFPADFTVGAGRQRVYTLSIDDFHDRLRFPRPKEWLFRGAWGDFSARPPVRESKARPAR